MTMQSLAPALAAVLLFVSSAAVIVAFLPAPLRPVDYFLAGSIGTLVAAAAVFAGYARLSGVGNLFYKRRPRPERRKSANPSILDL